MQIFKNTIAWFELFRFYRFLHGTQNYVSYFFGKQTYINPYKQTKNPKTNPKYFNKERMLKQHIIMAGFKHTYRPLYVENKTWGHLQNCRLRLKKANKAAKASKNRKRFRKSIIIIHSACSSCFHLQVSVVPANNKTVANIYFRCGSISYSLKASTQGNSNWQQQNGEVVFTLTIGLTLFPRQNFQVNKKDFHFP